MRRALCCWVVLLLIALISGCGQVNAATPRTNQPAAGTLTLTDLHGVSDLQARFNQDAGKPRLLLLVSPT